MTSRAFSNVPIGLAALAGLCWAAGPAAAQVQGETLQVQARIGELCTVTSASLDFGQLTDLATSGNQDASGEIDIDCGGVTTPINVALDGGLQGSGATRNMTSTVPTSFPITYLLFKDSQRTQGWVAGDQLETTIEGSGSVPVFGRVQNQSNGHPAGLYTDEVTITLSF